MTDPPQPTIHADDFDRFAQRWQELFESLDRQVQRIREQTR